MCGLTPYIAQRSPLFAEVWARGYLLKRPSGSEPRGSEQGGDVWQWDLWQPCLAVVDFTNHEAYEWWSAKLDALLDMGLRLFQERLRRAHPDGRGVLRRLGSGSGMHDYYT